MRGSTAGLSDGLKGSSKGHYLLLTLLDELIACLIISPLVVAYWRGTWGLMDHYVFPNRPDLSVITSLLIGLIGTLLFTLSQTLYINLLDPDKHLLSYYAGSRFYTACFGFVCINSFRGVWAGLDHFTPRDLSTVALLTSASILLLLVSRTLRNISAPPFAVVTDRYQGYFDVPTFFKASTKEIWLYLFDCSFSVCVIGSLVVFVWRGFWSLLDIFIYPEDPSFSAFMSLALGYCLVFLTFLLQPLMKQLAKTLRGLPRLALVDIYLIFSFCGTLNVWRGIWNLLNIYFLPDKPGLSFGLSHAVPFFLLVLINSSNSILVRGVYIDGEESGSQCVDFPCYYLRLFLQAKRKKRLLREAARSRGETLLASEKSITIIASNGPETSQLLSQPSP